MGLHHFRGIVKVEPALTGAWCMIPMSPPFFVGHPNFLVHVVVGALGCTGTHVACLQCLSTFHFTRDHLTTLFSFLNSPNMISNQSGVSHGCLERRLAASVACHHQYSLAEKQRMVSIVDTLMCTEGISLCHRPFYL